MFDTSPEIRDLLHQLMLKKAGQERLIWGCSMFDMSKRIVEDAILAENPGISPEELKIQLFMRFYKHDFSEQEQEKIINHFKKSYAR